MSEQQTQQTVVDDANPPAQPGGATQDARGTDDLDTLLKQYDESAPQPSQTQPEQSGTDPAIKALTDKVQRMESDRESEIFRRDMDATIKDVRGDLDPEFYDQPFVEAWIDARARSDPRLSQAWLNRNKNPQQFKKIVDGLGREFAKKFSKLPDKQVTEDREAVSHAVRGASTQAPAGKAPDYTGANDAEFRKDVRDKYGFNPL